MEVINLNCEKMMVSMFVMFLLMMDMLGWLRVVVGMTCWEGFVVCVDKIIFWVGEGIFRMEFL